MRKAACALVASLAIGFTGSAFSADVDSLVRQLCDGNAAVRESADQKLRETGWDTVAALRAFKSDNSEHVDRVREVMSDIAVDKAHINASDADTLKALAREEAVAKRYAHAEILYRRAEQIYDILKDDARTRKDHAKADEFAHQQNTCDRMKDKARNKSRGTGMTGLNLGFVRFGVSRDMSDKWE